ncbi:unnamed protein product, partial [Closterium sp. NIES-53]
ATQHALRLSSSFKSTSGGSRLGGSRFGSGRLGSGKQRKEVFTPHLSSTAVAEGVAVGAIRVGVLHITTTEPFKATVKPK